MAQAINVDAEIKECLWLASECRKGMTGQDIEGFYIEPYRPTQRELQAEAALANAIGWASR